MEGDITIEILNHDNDVCHKRTSLRFHCKKCEGCTLEGKMVKGWGYFKLIPIDAILRCDMNYLQNDTLSFRVSYDSINYWPTYVLLGVTLGFIGLVLCMIIFVFYCCCKRT